MADSWRWVRRPPAALVLGIFAGSLSAFTFLPTAIPLTWQVIQAEEAVARGEALAAAYAVHEAWRSGIRLEDTLARRGILSVVTWDGPEMRSVGVPLPESILTGTCGRPSEATSAIRREGGEVLAVACIQADARMVLVAAPVEASSPAQQALALVVFLALLVGIVTALGVLALLRPVSNITKALAQIGEGERGVRLQSTGLAELDELVDRLNSAARSVEDREDAILGHIAVVQEMARIVAHEIRNPLQSLELLSTLVALEDDATERHTIAESIHTEIRTLETVVNRMLRDSAVRGALRIQNSVQAIAPVLDQVITLRRPQANRRGVRIHITASSFRELQFDQPLVKRAVENLVVNSLQAVPDDTGIVQLSAIDEPDALVILVDDNGPGVPEQLIHHMFDMNVTSKKDGSGLGLPLVKGVLEAHGGSISYQESPLGGARFEARIPYRPAKES